MQTRRVRGPRGGPRHPRNPQHHKGRPSEIDAPCSRSTNRLGFNPVFPHGALIESGSYRRPDAA